MEIWSKCDICGRDIPVGELCYGLKNGNCICKNCCTGFENCTFTLAPMPTLTQPNEWVSVEERLPEPGERVLAAKGTFVGEAYMASNGAWMRHDGFPWEVDAWMPLPAPPGKGNNVPTNEPLTIEELREMDGRPVYLIVDDGYEPLEMWALIDVPEKDHIVLINNIGGRSAYYSDDDLERDHITVYRRPPEGEA